MNKIIIAFTLITLSACTNNITEHLIQCESKTASIKLDETTMEVVIDNNSYQLSKVVSASGIKYQSQSTLVWLKGNDAIMTIDSKKFNDCKLINTP